MIQFVPL